MDKAKLAKLRAKKLKEKADLDEKRHSDVIKSHESLSKAVEKLQETLGKEQKLATKELAKHLKELKGVITFEKDVKRLEKALNGRLENISKAVGNIKLDNSAVVKAIEDLTVTYEENLVDPNDHSQLAQDFMPVRRVIRLSSGNFVYDDTPTMSIGAIGGGGGSSFPSAVLRGGDSIAVVNPDGTPIAGGGGGGLTDDELRASPVPVDVNISSATDSIVARQDTADDLRTAAEMYVSGAPVSGANPVAVTGTVTATGAQLDIEEALNFTSYDLNAASYSDTTAISTDYQLSAIELRFTTAESKTITLTTEDGVQLYNSGSITAQNINIPFGSYFNGGENLTLSITQTSGACSVTGKLTIAQGSVALGGNPIVNLRGDGSAAWGDSSTDNDVKVTSDGELLTTSSERERNVMARYYETGVNSTRYILLVDLSDTTNFPHINTGRLDVSYVASTTDRDSSGAGTIAFGVITRVDGTNADITYFSRLTFEKSDTQHINAPYNVSPSQIKLGVVGGVTNKLVTNDKEVNVASVNTGAPLNSPVGTSTPGVGDIIVKLGRTTGTYDATLRVLYHSETSA